MMYAMSMKVHSVPLLQGITVLCFPVLMCLVLLQSGASPLYIACQRGHIDVVDTLLKGGADPNLACTVWGLVCPSRPIMYNVTVAV